MGDWCSLALILAGAFFFFAGTLGLVRFPDVYTRLHALTKADNLGLGLTVLGLILQAGSWFVVGQLVFIWLLVMVSSATACHLIARSALRSGVQPWERSR
jgi:multicomponent Na+:H+ antiporter subunit G